MSKCILVVEDNDSHAEIACRCLNKFSSSHSIIRMSNGQDAKEYLLQQKPTTQEWQEPQLILLDLRLPRISGIELLAEIRSHEKLANIPVIVFSSSAAQADIDAAYAHRVNSYIIKPMEYSEYMLLFETLTQYWLTLNVN